MTEHTIIKATVSAWLPSHSGPQDLQGAPEKAVAKVSYFEPMGDSAAAVWRSMARIVSTGSILRGPG